MDSPNSPSSPEMSHKRSGRPKSPSSDTKERVTNARFLVSNTAAGCIIGKGGSTITEFQTLSGSRIQLSRNQEFFPGTSDRIIMISGALDDILKATELITEKLFVETEENGDALPQRRDNNDVENRTKLRLIVPNGCCGGIIGKGGNTIKSFIEESQAGIKISPQDNMYSGLNDRIVTLTGSPEEQLRALYLILSKLSEDAHYSQSVNIPYTYAGTIRLWGDVEDLPYIGRWQLGCPIWKICETLNFTQNRIIGKGKNRLRVLYFLSMVQLVFSFCLSI